MRVEVSIAKEKAKAMPKGSISALTEEMTKRLTSRYEDVEGDKEYVQGVLQETWESADDWFA